MTSSSVIERLSRPPGETPAGLDVDAQVAQVMPLVAEAEATGRFPRQTIELLGSSGVFRARWSMPDSRFGVTLAESLGRAGAGGVALGITVHLEAGLSMLLRYGDTPELRDVADAALDGQVVLAVAASETGGGSDPSRPETTARADGNQLTVSGQKRYVTNGRMADFLVTLCVLQGGRSHGRPCMVLVPREVVSARKVLHTTGVRSSETTRVSIDGRVPQALMIGRPGAGMEVLTWGLTHERLATAALAVGTATLAIGLATAHLERRVLAGRALGTRQALRLRLAQHAAEVGVLRRGLHSLAGEPLTSSAAIREVAGLKVTASRIAERAVSECMHLFGGLGYLEDEAPLARLWRDVRAARLGGGTDELMWELVAGGLRPAGDAYEEMIESSRCDCS